MRVMTAPLLAPNVRTTPANGVGYAGLGLGILAVLSSVLLVGLLFGSLAIALGLAGSDAVEDGAATNRKSATAAVVLGVVAIVISFVAMVIQALPDSLTPDPSGRQALPCWLPIRDLFWTSVLYNRDS